MRQDLLVWVDPGVHATSVRKADQLSCDGRVAVVDTDVHFMGGAGDWHWVRQHRLVVSAEGHEVRCGLRLRRTCMQQKRNTVATSERLRCLKRNSVRPATVKSR